MKWQQTVWVYVACVGLTACGITPASNVVGYSYVSGHGDGSLAVTGVKGSTGGATNGNATGGASTTSATTTSGGTTGGSSASTTTSGAGTTGGNTTSGSTTSGSTTTSGVPDPNYTVDNLRTDMTSVLQSHAPMYSNSNLGNPANVALWDATALQSLYDGLIAVETFYPNLTLRDLAHLYLALGATDSTGDYRVNNGGSVGYLQVSTGSCQTDYVNHGVAINGPDGELISPTNITLTTPGTNVVIMAWYTRNAVSSGESANEAAAGLHDHVVTRDVGNGILSWLVGPGSDRHNMPSGSDAATRWPDFYNRILDYYVQGGFGDQASFDAILNSAMPSTLQAFKDAPAGAFP